MMPSLDDIAKALFAVCFSVVGGKYVSVVGGKEVSVVGGLVAGILAPPNNRTHNVVDGSRFPTHTNRPS